MEGGVGMRCAAAGVVAGDDGGGGCGGAVRVGEESKCCLFALTQEEGEGGDGPWVSAGMGPWE